MYASAAQIAKQETVHLASLHCENQNILLVVDTTVPIPQVPNTATPNPELTVSRQMSQQTINTDSMEDSLGPVNIILYTFSRTHKNWLKILEKEKKNTFKRNLMNLWGYICV